MLIFDTGTDFRLPLPSFPYLAPQIQVGVSFFDNQNSTDGEKWDNTALRLTVGADLAYRFNRVMEAGIQITGGYAHALFADLDPARGILSNPNLIFEATPHLSLSPFFNFTFEIRPAIRYYHSLGALTSFDGLYFGIGASLSLRLGEDPDTDSAIIRSIRFTEPQIAPLFAAMQSYYTQNPIGKVVLTNTEKYPLHDVEVTFFQPGYMDSPTPALSLPTIGPGESITAAFPAVFNGNVFETEGVTPLTGTVQVLYRARGRSVKQTLSIPYDLHDKTALIWDNDQKMGAFITPADSGLREFASTLRRIHRDEVIPGFSEEVQFALQAYNALTEMGMLYQPDPSTAFAQVQGNSQSVDSISLPRETLDRITGDCDDLTALFCTLMETVNIETAFVTTPGHIFAGFNTGVEPREYRKLHPERSMTLAVDGELWVLIEVTMIGKADFLKAWRTGMQEFRSYVSEPEKRGFYSTAEAQKLFRPIGLKQNNREYEPGDPARLIQGYRDTMTDITGQILEEYRRAAEESGRSRVYIRYGIQAAELRRLDTAEQAFRTALVSTRNPLPARVNLGALLFLREKYGEAATVFEAVLEDLNKNASANPDLVIKILINLSKARREQGRDREAQIAYERALALDPEAVKAYSYLARISADSNRGEEVDHNNILFIEEE